MALTWLRTTGVARPRLRLVGSKGIRHEGGVGERLSTEMLRCIQNSLAGRKERDERRADPVETRDEGTGPSPARVGKRAKAMQENSAGDEERSPVGLEFAFRCPDEPTMQESRATGSRDSTGTLTQQYEALVAAARCKPSTAQGWRSDAGGEREVKLSTWWIPRAIVLRSRRGGRGGAARSGYGPG